MFVNGRGGGRGLDALLPSPPPWGTPTLPSPSSGPGTREATYLAPGRWGCRRAPPGQLRAGRPRGPREKYGRCGVGSRSSPPGRWQPGHGRARCLRAARPPSPASPPVGFPFTVSSRLPRHHLWGSDKPQGGSAPQRPGITLHQSKGGHMILAPTSQRCCRV